MEVMTKNTMVYESLRDDIVYGNLRPGERLVISDLVSKYDVSPMPVREAISRLKQEGFIEVIPHIGARVMEINLEKFREILIIRLELEPLACRLAVPYITESTIKECDELISTMDSYLGASNYRQYINLDRKLHMLIYCASPYTILQDLVRNLWDRSAYSRNIFRFNPSSNKVSHEEHKEWVEALRVKDEKKAEEVVYRQKKRQFDRLLQLLEQQEQAK